MVMNTPQIILILMLVKENVKNVDVLRTERGNQKMEVKFKKVSDKAITPSYAKPGDNALDLTAIGLDLIDSNLFQYDTGIAVEIPVGFVGLVYPRSSISKIDMILANGVGVIDSSYRGSIKLRFKVLGSKTYSIGDRVGQLMIVPCPVLSLVEVETLSGTSRGAGGFGSTGC